jgi:hypothetical protein
MKLNLLALLKNGILKRIVTSGPLQDEITDYFSKLKVGFEEEKSEIDFDGRYCVEADEILSIKEYPIDQTIKEAVINPLTLDMLDLDGDRDNIKALVSGFWGKTERYITFQAFDTRKILSKKLTLIHSNNTFTKLVDPGLVIDDKIDIIFQNNRLFFNSFHNARKIFDLSEYYKEATNEDLSEFSQNEMFSFDDQQWFIENADSTMRKKVTLLQKNKVLENTKPKVIKDAAKEFGIQIEIITVEGKKKIKFPKDKKLVKEIIRFLDEDYFFAPLTKRKCLTNSKRYL